MKFIITLLFTVPVFASEPIIINSAKITIPESILKGAIVLERNSESPAIVELTIPSHKQKECARHELKQIYGEHTSCGSYSVPDCRNEEFNCESRVRCTLPSELFGCQMEEWYKVCQNRVVCTESTRSLSCYHEAKVCAEYKEVAVAPKKGTLIFKLGQRRSRKTHQIRLSLNTANGLSVVSPQLSVEYDFSQSAWIISK